MYQDLLVTLQNSFDSLSKSQKAIASYLINNYDKAAYMTASKLAQETGVSESTVVRFATEMGFDGYPALASYLQVTVYSRMTAAQRLRLTNHLIGEGDVLEKTLAADIESLNNTLANMDRKVFAGAVDAICSAKTIFVIGVRNAAPLASGFSYSMGQVFDNVRNISTTNNDEVFEKLVRIRENDVLVAFSFPRYSKRVIRTLDFAKKHKATVVSITDSLYSPLVPLSDFCLMANSSMSSMCSSLVTPMYVINALLTAIGKKQETMVLEKLEELEALWKSNSVYESIT
ncbi:MAG TPA: N-acetylmannosamine kinase [Clostridiales bacterium]|jgi:DNA-binding MurR/RpiR family transcriptional regulator|nr:N-acetylmannosamine kinase [Clostridiales bacterium]